MTPTAQLAYDARPVTLEDILVTDVLPRRAPRAPDFPAEIAGLHALAHCLAEQPDAMLPRLLEIATVLCDAGTAGLSLLEHADTGDLFRWRHLAGALKPSEGGSTPRAFSPCGVTLDRGAPQLFSYPARYFTYFDAAIPPIVEALVIPIYWNGRALGTIWIVAHDEARRFDAEDVRVMQSLASFTAAALCVREARTAAEVAAERMAREDERSEWLRRLISGQEEERSRIARELHDEMSQHLTCLTLGLHAVAHAANDSRPEILGRLQELVATIDRGVHRLSRDLRPAALDDLGLTSALVAFADEWSRSNGIACACSARHGQQRLPSAVEITVYRIVQEALTNVARHARARQASVRFRRHGDRVTLVVADDGAGFDVDAAGRRPRLGLVGIRERAALLGGTVAIDSSPAGTTLSVTLSLSGSRIHA
ncbi:MAG: hypothetical protein JWL71_4300 [Acidobacteria bacterium]|nr:hypothetical protein [Acidobacteriota bacterium]